jgi:FlaA1/EpsC-like NDP-sugar epimerase
MSQPASPTFLHRLDRFLARLRPRRELQSLAINALMIAVAWNATYLFRLGLERRLHERLAYDGWVLLGAVMAYLLTFVWLRVPQSMWRFSGFGESKRLPLGCPLAGVFSAAVVMGRRLYGVPRAVLALHPFVALIAVCTVRLGYRALYEHARPNSVERLRVAKLDRSEAVARACAWMVSATVANWMRDDEIHIALKELLGHEYP